MRTNTGNNSAFGQVFNNAKKLSVVGKRVQRLLHLSFVKFFLKFMTI